MSNSYDFWIVAEINVIGCGTFPFSLNWNILTGWKKEPGQPGIKSSIVARVGLEIWLIAIRSWHLTDWIKRADNLYAVRKINLINAKQKWEVVSQARSTNCALPYFWGFVACTPAFKSEVLFLVPDLSLQHFAYCYFLMHVSHPLSIVRKITTVFTLWFLFSVLFGFRIRWTYLNYSCIVKGAIVSRRRRQQGMGGVF